MVINETNELHNSHTGAVKPKYHVLFCSSTCGIVPATYGLQLQLSLFGKQIDSPLRLLRQSGPTTDEKKSLVYYHFYSVEQPMRSISCSAMGHFSFAAKTRPTDFSKFV
jgi:hypothetical protein